MTLMIGLIVTSLSFASEAFDYQAKTIETAMLKANYMAKGDNAGGSGAAHKGMFILQPDLNVGSNYGGRYYNGGFFMPGFTFNIDIGVHDYVSVGPYAGFGARNGFYYIGAGARGVFHWWQLVDDKVSADLKSDAIDFYLPVFLGVDFGKYKGYGSGARFKGGAGLGFRYYFVEKFGVNLEWGWMEMSYAKIGVTIKVK